MFYTSLWVGYHSNEVCKVCMQQLDFQRLAKSANCSSRQISPSERDCDRNPQGLQRAINTEIQLLYSKLGIHVSAFQSSLVQHSNNGYWQWRPLHRYRMKVGTYNIKLNIYMKLLSLSFIVLVYKSYVFRNMYRVSIKNMEPLC